MSVPQIRGSIVTNQAENHVSLVPFHINFTLVKIEPPAEYQAIGQSLSARRKNDADEGQSHLTAVQLGVLFGSIIPDVPNLIKAYGLRCSEVAKSPTFNPQGSSRHGLFANEVGADGTAVWAAATSGTAAIAVHLLGCMLSRMWDPPEAISIWMQLIAERKASLAASGNPIETDLSDRIVLNREQIANWHTSIQAWRRTADEANARRQDQLMLIINNLGLAINTKLSVSESVIDAWMSALVTVDNLVSGKPQSVQTGAPLLGLSSWHIYPDMVVFGSGKNSKATKVSQNDPHVVRGGVLTLGIHDLRRSGEGIHWSLPLAYLRYYGQPVHSEARLSTRTSRTSFEDLVYVALGSLTRRWVSHPRDIDLSAQMLVQLQKSLAAATLRLAGGQAWPGNTWVDLIASQAEKFLDATGEVRNSILQLIRCGSRRYPLFLDDPIANQIFGFSTPGTILNLLAGEEDRVRLLRQIAKDFGDDRNLMLIQYRSDTVRGDYEIASVEKLPSRRSVNFDPIRNTTESPQQYIRWIDHSRRIFEHQSWPDTEVQYLNLQMPFLYGVDGHQWRDPPHHLVSPLLEKVSSDRLEGGVFDPQIIRGITMRSTLAFGDPEVAALYCVSFSYWTSYSPNAERKVISGEYRALPNIVLIRHVLWAFQRDLFDPRQLLGHFTDGQLSSKLLRALRALSTAASLYKNLRNATVELRAAEQPLFDHQWVPAESRRASLLGHVFNGYYLGREHMFACVAKFESGTFNFHGSAMNGVLAISSGNCIYVASCLLQDPCIQTSNESIERVIGNLGKTGMCLLVCPAVPQVRSVSEDIRLVNHYPFDGKEENCFAETSLHLSYTEWQLPIDVGSRGNRDVQASYVEAAIGLYDRSRWVADLNVLDVFNPQLCRIVPECRVHRAGQAVPREQISEFVSIDCWEELLDSPTEIGVVRARRNWQARLAAAALAIQRGHDTRIVPDNICWHCCLALETLPDTKKAENQDTDMIDDSIGHLEWLSDDDRSDSETEDMVASLLRRNVGKGDRQHPGTSEQAEYHLANNRNIVYIV